MHDGMRPVIATRHRHVTGATCKFGYDAHVPIWRDERSIVAEGHNECVRSRDARDEQTIAIAMALVIVTGTVTMGVVLGVFGAVSGAWDFDVAFNLGVVAAVVSGALYLFGQGRA